MCRKQLVESTKVHQHKVTKLFSACNSNTPPSSYLSRCYQITKILEKLVLAAIRRQSTPQTTQRYDEVHSAKYLPSVSRYLALAFVTDPWRCRRAPGRQCSLLHVVPDFMQPRSSKNTSLAMVSINALGTQEAHRIWRYKVLSLISDSFGTSLTQYVSCKAHLKIVAHAPLSSELLSTFFWSTFVLSSS